MINLFGKNILIIIPKSQFCDYELNGVRANLQQSRANVVVVSKSGQESRGMYKQKFQPDGMIVDWNKQLGIGGKYHAVIVIGGRGARKSLWDDPIVPQIITDHYRFGSIIGAIGTSLVVLVRASLITCEIPMPEDDFTRKELEKLNAVCIDVPVICVGNLVLGRGGNSVHQFSQTIIGLLETQ